MCGPLKVGDKITVVPSKELEQRGNARLAGKTATVTQIVRLGKKIVGIFADLQTFRRVRNYYIPSASVMSRQAENQIKTLRLLKTTIL